MNSLLDVMDIGPCGYILPNLEFWCCLIKTLPVKPNWDKNQVKGKEYNLYHSPWIVPPCNVFQLLYNSSELVSVIMRYMYLLVLSPYHKNNQLCSMVLDQNIWTFYWEYSSILKWILTLNIFCSSLVIYKIRQWICISMIWIILLHIPYLEVNQNSLWKLYVCLAYAINLSWSAGSLP